jgi:hypothetical protein
MYDLILAFLVLNHAGAVTLGVGASTLAIAGFLTAIADGNFEQGERRIMGVVYISLRVAMITIFLATVAIWFMDPNYFGDFTMPLWIMTAILFVNALFMTKHWISPKLGPAIQAGTWYTLGFLITIYMFDLFQLTSAVFLWFFIGDILVAVVTVNVCMWYLKRRQKQEGGGQQ